MKVYLSSTLNDLKPERDAVREALGDQAMVVESYTSNDESLVKGVSQDIRGCDVYIGIFGLRYGFVPPGQAKSITHLEYDRATELGLPRFVFVKNKNCVLAIHHDAETGEHPRERIEELRKAVSSGGDTAPTSGQFDTAENLKLAVVKALAKYRSRITGQTAEFVGPKPHPWEVTYEVSIACVPGTDDNLRDILARESRDNQRITLFPLAPNEESYYAALDAVGRRSRSVMLLISSASLARIKAIEPAVAAAVSAVKARCGGIFALLVDVTPADLPSTLADALTHSFTTTGDAWSKDPAATFKLVQQKRRELSPDGVETTTVSLPYMVVAMNEGEAAKMSAAPDALFAQFGGSATHWRQKFDAVHQRVHAIAPEWPKAFYRSSRQDWKPFGAGQPSMAALVALAARKLNTAPSGSRERRLLRNTQIVLHAYSFDEYLEERVGFREHVKAMCDAGCLVIVDELALLHPSLRPHIKEVLSSNNTAVVAISACDPAYSALPPLLEDLSHLQIGNIVSRFRQVEDIRCELAINSVERLQRWLRLVLPELMTTLAHEQSDPVLVGQLDRLFGTPGR